jgi:ATP-dependent DNA helicase RecG
LTEGRCTGVPKMREAMANSGSPPPKFATDEGRTYFLVELPVHSEMPGVWPTHDEVHDGGLTETEERILALIKSNPPSRLKMADMLGMKSKRTGHLTKAMDRLRKLGLAELTIPDKPQSKNQKLRITEKGRAWLAKE